jgi:hypothetical protein
LSSVDLPALGRPMMETKPERKAILFIMRCCWACMFRPLGFADVGYTVAYEFSPCAPRFEALPVACSRFAAGTGSCL